MDPEQASVRSWLWDHVPGPSSIFHYILTLLPLPLWVLSYNLSWLFEDAAAGVAMSMVIIPQSIAFGIMSRISPAHGLYSTFAGLMLY